MLTQNHLLLRRRHPESRFHADIVAQLSTALRADFAAAAQHAGVVLAEDAEKAEAGDAASVKTQADTLT